MNTQPQPNDPLHYGGTTLRDMLEAVLREERSEVKECFARDLDAFLLARARLSKRRETTIEDVNNLFQRFLLTIDMLPSDDPRRIYAPRGRSAAIDSGLRAVERVLAESNGGPGGSAAGG